MVGCVNSRLLSLFCRNVAYESTERGLADLFSSRFGQISYTTLLIDHMTERSKGMAFVQFKHKSDADKCLAATSEHSQQVRTAAASTKLLLQLLVLFYSCY